MQKKKRIQINKNQVSFNVKFNENITTMFLSLGWFAKKFRQYNAIKVEWEKNNLDVGTQQYERVDVVCEMPFSKLERFGVST